MPTNINVKENQLLLKYEYYDCKIKKYCTTTYPIYCLSNDEAIKIKDRLLPQYEDLGTAKNEVYRCIEDKDFYDYHIRELLVTFPNHNEYKNVEMTIYINGAEVLLNIPKDIKLYFNNLVDINNRNNNLDAYVIRNVQPAEHVNAISHTNIIGCVEGEIEIISNNQRIRLENGRYSVGILLYKALLFVRI